MESLRGQLLVAGPDLLDPNFRRTVVLVGEHGEEGAMGVVLNRPSPVTVDDAVPPLAGLVDDGDVVHVGGPVQPQAIVVLGDFEQPERAGSIVLGSVGFLPADVDEDADLGPLPRVRVFAGYAGWAPGQLEAEVARGDWLIGSADSALIFDEAPNRVWGKLLERFTGDWAAAMQAVMELRG